MQCYGKIHHGHGVNGIEHTERPHPCINRKIRIMIFFHEPFGRIIIALVVGIRQHNFIQIFFRPNQPFPDKLRFTGQAVCLGTIFFPVMTFTNHRSAAVRKVDGIHSDFFCEFNLIDFAGAHDLLLYHSIDEVHKRHPIRFFQLQCRHDTLSGIHFILLGIGTN